MSVSASLCVRWWWYLGGLGVVRTLGVFALLDVLHHLPQEGMAVVLVLGHQHLQHEPQAPGDQREVTTPEHSLCVCVCVRGR